MSTIKNSLIQEFLNWRIKLKDTNNKIKIKKNCYKKFKDINWLLKNMKVKLMQ